MRFFIDLDEAMKMVYGYATECFPDEYENVPNGSGGFITKIVWWSDKDGGNDTIEYMNEEEWSEWACSHFRAWKEVRIVESGIEVYGVGDEENGG